MAAREIRRASRTIGIKSMSVIKAKSVIVLFSLGLIIPIPEASSETDQTVEARGKYLIEIGSCNDCHTAGFAHSGGTIPESEWLLGDSLGYRGPWGTTYPSNLRQYVGDITENEWIANAESLRTIPPMPWWSLNAMTREDLIAMYRYIKSLDPLKADVPSYVPPPKTPETPYIQWPEPTK